MIDGKAVVTDASIRTVLTQNLGGLPYPPRDLYRQVGLAITAE